jgi:signal transduction histidine kinase
MSYYQFCQTGLDQLEALLLDKDNELKLMRKILAFAKQGEFTKYTSTLEEAWRISIVGLTDSLLKQIQKCPNSLPELTVEDDYSRDPAAAFGIREAQLHRSRGITLSLFLALMKYYRQSYLDLVSEAGFSPAMSNYYHLFIERFFDRVEIGFTSEWALSSKDKLMEELRMKNRQMTNEKNKYLTIFESLNTPVILLDERFHINNVNSAAMDLFEGIRSPGSYYYNPDQVQIDIPWLQSLIREKFNHFDIQNQKLPANTHFEKEIPTRFGPRIFEIRVQFMLDVSDKFSGVVLIFYDMTDRIEFDNIRKRFVSTVSHELRTPISAIELSVKNLEKHSEHIDAANRTKLINMISSSASVLSKMIEDLLILSRVDSQRLSMNFELIDLEKVIPQVLYELEPKSNLKKIKFTHRIPGPVHINADKTRVMQILRIFLDNAIKYSHEAGTVEIFIQPQYLGKYNPRNLPGILISIQDHGIGIKASDLPNIYQRFFRAEEVKDIPGTGLGLAIAKELLEYHGGSIDCVSKFGEGTTFFIFFPENPAPIRS